MFARQDLGKDPPFSRLDLISCRNVLIYLGSSLQKRIIPAFHYALKPDGFLLLGTSESIGGFAELFELVDKQHKIYRKKPGVSHLHFHPDAIVAPARTEPHPGMPAAVGEAGNVEREADKLLLGRYSPPGVLINEAMNIIQFRGHTGRYLEPAAGTASLNLMKMVRTDLQMPLRKAINEAMHRGTQARAKEVRVRINGSARAVTLDVIPVGSVPVSQGRYFMVLFIEREGAEPPEPRPRTIPRGKRARNREQSEVEQLRQELNATRDYLQSVIEEQEAANEELRSANEEAQSTNEELQSINEELETAKEELQSTNEELTTINEELENVNQELTQANNDLKNLFDGVDVAIVMLGSDLRIRRFTPPAAALLNLIATDVGRPLADLRPRMDAPELENWITGVTETLVPVSHVVQDHAGTRYDVRIKPYRTAENKIDGVVLTIVDRSSEHG
jgi:two-component system CheB/CheR fusion protein